MIKDLVIYHANCMDGFGAAFAAWLKLGDAAEYIPMNYGELGTPQALAECFDETIHERIIYILDFSMCEQTMRWLFENAKSVVWLDHHKTAFEMWLGRYDRNMRFEDHAALSRIILDDGKSGAMIAWEWFHGADDVPMFIRHIDDRDRWQFKINGTTEFCAALFSTQPWTFNGWKNGFIGMSGDSPYCELDQLYAEGAVLLAEQHRRVQAAQANARECRLVPGVINSVESYQAPWTWESDPIDGDVCCARGLMCNAGRDIASDLGHALATSSGSFGLVWYVDGQDVARCSLRSNGEYDVSAIAKAFGGGGHKNAAGFSMPAARFMNMFYGEPL